MIDLSGKEAIVTGGGSGIGRGICSVLALAGANVLVTDISRGSAEETMRYCSYGGDITAKELDVTNEHSIDKIISEHIKERKKIDILVNNAGNNIPEHFTKVQKKNMEYLVKLNTISTFNIAQLCTLKMLESRNRRKIGGSIINMSSQMAHVGGPIRSVYNMTKSGLEGLTRGMAIDLAKNNIRVNTVCPTFIVTPMTKKFLKNKKFKNAMLKNIPLGRFAQTSDVATAVAFLASDSSSMITGTSILVDGGWTAI